MNKILTFISDTHNKHKALKDLLPGGDILIHSGDISSRGYDHEIENFCKWFNEIDNYGLKIFIAGNHDFGFQDNYDKSIEIVKSYENIIYLQDDLHLIGDDYSTSIKIWGSPWQPEFCNWAFNAKRGEDIKQHWDKIPMGVDILITHGPSFGKLDKVIGRNENLGCEELDKKIKEIKPKIFICGHIHSGRGYYFDGNTHYFNASILNERYEYEYKPITIDWNIENNEIKFLQ